MTRRLNVKLDARVDLLRQFDWFYERSPQTALRFFERANEMFEFLRVSPFVGRPWPRPPRRLPGLRVISLTGFERVLIFYRPAGNTIEVIRAIHGARDLRPALKSRSW